MNTKVLYEVHCPICRESVGVIGEKTETYSQYVAYCKECGQEFTVNNFRVKIYMKLEAQNNDGLQRSQSYTRIIK